MSTRPTPTSRAARTEPNAIAREWAVLNKEIGAVGSQIELIASPGYSIACRWPRTPPRAPLSPVGCCLDAALAGRASAHR